MAQIVETYSDGFCKALYDLDLLQYENYIPDSIHDVQFAEPLLDENKKRYSLDALAQEYLGEKKQDKEIEEWCQGARVEGQGARILLSHARRARREILYARRAANF